MNLETSPVKTSRGPGRPREFEADEAVDRAIDVFRQRGYSATSVSDLMAATGLARGSVYKAFKDKKSLFLAAYDRYAARGTGQLDAILRAEGSGKARLRRVLESYAAAASGDQGRLGCLVVATAVESSSLEPEIADKVAVSLDRVERVLRELVRQGVADGSLRADVDAKRTATTLLCLLQGLRVVGKSAGHRRKLRGLVDSAMKIVD